MPYLNLACGATRPGSPWVNLDTLHSFLSPGTPERRNLETEKNYVNHWLGHTPMPFQPDSFDGILASHCVEHWDAQMAVKILNDCYRILKPGGVLVVSVPDASIFRRLDSLDKPDNAVAVFGEPITPGEGPTFLQYALLFRAHVQVLTEDALWALLRGAGFEDGNIGRKMNADQEASEHALKAILNRLKFSLVMSATK